MKRVAPPRPEFSIRQRLRFWWLLRVMKFRETYGRDRTRGGPRL